jgi:hypothetical protein
MDEPNKLHETTEHIDPLFIKRLKAKLDYHLANCGLQVSGVGFEIKDDGYLINIEAFHIDDEPKQKPLPRTL